MALLLAIAATGAGLVLTGAGVSGVGGAGERADRFGTGAALVPTGALLLGLGLAAGWLSFGAARGRPARPVALPSWWLCAAVFAAAAGAGHMALRADRLGLFLPCAVVATLAPVAAAGRLGLPGGAGRPSWRRVLPAFAWGATGALAVALIGEVLAALGAFAAAAAGFAAGGDGNVATLWRMVDQLQRRPPTEAGLEALLPLLLRQPLVLALAAFVLVFAGPVIEELSKFLAVLVFGRPRPRAAAGIDPACPDRVLTTFLIGLAAGLGFAATENIFYTAQAGPGGWTGLTIVRGATPLMHGTASALLALGWARQAREPGGWALLRGAVGSFALHGAWNLCAGLVAVTALSAVGAGSNAARSAAGLAAAVLVLALAALVLIAAGTLLRLRAVLGDEANAEAGQGDIPGTGATAGPGRAEPPGVPLAEPVAPAP